MFTTQKSRLGDHLKVRHGRSQRDVETNNGKYPILATGGQIGWTNTPLYSKPSVLIGRKGTIDRPRYQDSPFWTVDTLFYTEIDEGADPKYFYYLFQMIDWRSKNESSGVPSLSSSTIESVEVVVPLLQEQQVIAKALSDADDVVTTLERMIAKKQAIKCGMMQQLLTGGTRLPGFSMQWKDILLGDHVRYVKTVALSRAQLDNESPLRYLHYGDIHASSDTRLSAATTNMPRVAISLASSAGLLMVGDVIFADASEDPAGVGKSVEITSVPDEGVVPGLHTIAARFDKAVLADGFKAYLQFIPEFRRSLLRLAAGTKVLATTRTYISSISLQLPEVDEQRAIARVLRDADNEIDTLKSRLVKARKIKQGMMQELLTGRTRLQPAEIAV